ncbi:hypothetical protein SAMN05444920_101367 [Nonomuraea solani]|uniref:Uncharacterized protein n=1 Tax=Nonomuraea solani TaxID=1144553 RepID=A0A1H5U030_9ACTN|nr:hypothetical protein [Nonomuraea solani]SEF68406.1 hypothetical protein SAMN05444920_101367 [Nonomuraea solani]
MDVPKVQSSLRLIARGLEELAAALGEQEAGEDERTARVIREWGRRGLTQKEASALFQRHGFAPQTTGGWTRGEWIEIGDDGLRYLTARSHTWLEERS